jgi:hypothetical protein
MNKAFFFITFCLLTTTLPAQIVNVWKGGSPGHETDWNYHKNWSLAKTPDVFHAVVIPDISTKTRKYPFVKSGEIDVQSIEIQSGAKLYVLPSVCISTDRFTCDGVCEGCEHIIVAKNDPIRVATISNH